jgi:hypothetical protein
VNSAATTNATSVKASGGALNGLIAANNGAAWAYLKLYNKASAPAVGTDAPIEIIGIPPGGRVDYQPSAGVYYSAGIAYAITGGAANADMTAVAANQVVGSIQYG